MDLKTKAVNAVLRHDEQLYLNTRNPRHVWHAWQLARQEETAIPDWVLRFVDGIAKAGVSRRSRKTDTADRYEAALTQMDAAVERHRRRPAIGKLGKQLGVPVEISRRDEPNLSAIARAAAKVHKVSVNRLLARYRSTR